MSKTAQADAALLDGAEIRRLREKAKKTMTELAAAAGMSESFLSRVERGEVQEVSVGRAVAIARVLGVSVEDFVR